jgi:hypothetical protein
MVCAYPRALADKLVGLSLQAAVDMQVRGKVDEQGNFSYCAQCGEPRDL